MNLVISLSTSLTLLSFSEFSFFRNLILIKLLDVRRSVKVSFSFLYCTSMLYFALVRSKSQYGSIIWNSIPLLLRTSWNESSETKQLHVAIIPFSSRIILMLMRYNADKCVPCVKRGITVIQHCFMYILFKF